MIICVCHNVSEKKIREAVDSGAKTMPQLREQLSVGSCCGRCNSCAKTVLRECLEDGLREAQPLMFETAMAA